MTLDDLDGGTGVKSTAVFAVRLTVDRRRQQAAPFAITWRSTAASPLYSVCLLSTCRPPAFSYLLTSFISGAARPSDHIPPSSLR